MTSLHGHSSPERRYIEQQYQNHTNESDDSTASSLSSTCTMSSMLSNDEVLWSDDNSEDEDYEPSSSEEEEREVVDEDSEVRLECQTSSQIFSMLYTNTWGTRKQRKELVGMICIWLMFIFILFRFTSWPLLIRQCVTLVLGLIQLPMLSFIIWHWS